jgi:hypothetical protein
MNEQMVRVRVRDGVRFGARNQYAPGDELEVPASALAAFGDKLEVVEPATPASEKTKRNKQKE